MATFKLEDGTEVQGFTQEELDKIVGERLAKAKAKFEEENKKKDPEKKREEVDFDKAIEEKLQKRLKEIEDEAKIKLALETEIKKKSIELGVPETLLKAGTLEEIGEKAKALEELKKSTKPLPEINRDKKPNSQGTLPIL